MSPADRPVRPEGDDTPRQDVYVFAGPGLVEHSREVGDGVVVDYATDGSVVGVEVLDVQRVTINNRAASAAPETSPAKPPLFLTSFERDYVQALNAILGSRGEGADVHRWRGHAEALRQVCERIRRDLGLPAANYTTESWRARNGVYQQDYLDSIHRPAARAATPAETTEH